MRSKIAFLEIVILLLIIGTSIFIMTVDMQSLAKKWGITPKEVTRTQKVNRFDQDIRSQSNRPSFGAKTRDFSEFEAAKKELNSRPDTLSFKNKVLGTKTINLSAIYEAANNGDLKAQVIVSILFMGVAGLFLAAIGHFLLLIEAFGVSVLWGFGLFLFPGIAYIPFLILHWDVARRPFLLILVGIGSAIICFLGVFMF